MKYSAPLAKSKRQIAMGTTQPIHIHSHYAKFFSYLPPFSPPTSHPLTIPPSSPTIVHQYDRLIVGSLSQPLGAKIGMRTGEHTHLRAFGRWETTNAHDSRDFKATRLIAKSG